LIVTPTLFYPESFASRFRFRLKRKLLDGLAYLGMPDSNRWGHLRLPDLWLPSTATEAQGLSTFYGITPEKIHVLPNGVHERFYTSDGKLFRSEYRIDSPFVLHVGRFHPVKNQKTLIEAVRLAQTHCVFLGDPDPSYQNYQRECQELAREAEVADPSGKTRFFFIPAIPHEDPRLASAYAAASVFALPSHFETFGLAPLEAAVAGCPLVLTRNIRSLEIFAEHAKLIDPQDRHAIAREIRNRLSSDSQASLSTIASESRRKLFERYRWEKIASDLENLYKGFAGFPTATSPGATSRVTTAPAPTTQ
jgi:hypothetical protein